MERAVHHFSCHQLEDFLGEVAASRRFTSVGEADKFIPMFLIMDNLLIMIKRVLHQRPVRLYLMGRLQGLNL